MAVTGQPTKMDTMVPAPGTMAMPQGLAYLATLDQLIIRQKKELFEIMTGFETCNRYEIINSMNQQIFFVQEESSFCERCFVPNIRGFDLHITDNNVQEVMRISREFKFFTGCCWCADGCCNMELIIQAPVGRLIGKVRTSTSKCMPHIKLYDATDKHMFTIWGPCCPCQAVCCPDDINFPITDPSLQTKVGNIAKQWRGCCVESFTDADQFCLTFPQDMSVDSKCLLMGSLFLVEYLVFERQKNNNK